MPPNCANYYELREDCGRRKKVGCGSHACLGRTGERASRHPPSVGLDAPTCRGAYEGTKAKPLALLRRRLCLSEPQKGHADAARNSANQPDGDVGHIGPYRVLPGLSVGRRPHQPGISDPGRFIVQAIRPGSTHF